MLLCAALGTVIDVEASGADEEQALRAVENAFVSADDPTDDDSGRDLEARGNRP
jgi:hypothetical protein